MLSAMLPGLGLGGAGAIGPPTSFGSKIVSGSPPGSTITLTTSAMLGGGNLALCFVIYSSGTASPDSISVSSVSDGTNSYTHAFTAGGGGSTYGRIELWYKENAAAVAAGSTLTVTMSGAGSGTNAGNSVQCFQVSGILSASSLDKTATSTTNSTTPSIATGTLAQANEIVFGASYNDNQARTYTESSGFINLIMPPGSSGTSAGIGYKIVASTSSVTYQPAWSTTAALDMETGLASFKGH